MAGFVLSGKIQTALIIAAEEKMSGRIFGLDPQLIVDACILALSVFVLFTALSYLLFKPARAFLAKRQEFIQSQLDAAAKDKKDAGAFKAEYDAKLKEVNKESEQILSEARKKALKRETEIIANAEEEAKRLKDRAVKDIELEKSKVRNEVKQEMISVASAMAGKIVGAAIDEKKQAALIDETLKEMGDKTWGN